MRKESPIWPIWLPLANLVTRGEGQIDVDLGGEVGRVRLRALRFEPWAWVVINQQSLDALQSPLHSLMQISALASAIGLVVAVIALSWIVQRLLGRPLDGAVRALESVAEGKLDVHMAARGDDEIGRLYRAMETTTNALRERIEREQEQALQGMRVRRGLVAAASPAVIVDAEQKLVFVNSAMTVLAQHCGEVLQSLQGRSCSHCMIGVVQWGGQSVTCIPSWRASRRIGTASSALRKVTCGSQTAICV